MNTELLKIFCKAYFISPHCRYSIAAVVCGVDSEPAKWQEIYVSPRYEKDNIPIIEDISKENGTVSFELKRNGDNANCKVCKSFHKIINIKCEFRSKNMEITERQKCVPKILGKLVIRSYLSFLQKN